MFLSILLALGGVAHASDVTLPVQARLIDATGAPVNTPVDLTLALCPNATPTGGEVCYSETFTAVSPQDGFIAETLGASGGLSHTTFEAPALYLTTTVAGVELAPRQALGNLRPRPLGVTATVHLGQSGWAAPPAATTGTVVLSMDFESGFSDQSSYAHAVQANGGAKIIVDPASGSHAVVFGSPGPSWLRIPANAAFQVNSGVDFTVDYWARYETDTGGADMRLFQFGANTTDGFGINHHGANTNISFAVANNDVSGIPHGPLVGTGWHHFAWARQGSTLRGFLDGQLIQTKTFTSTNNSTYDMYFSAYPGAPGSTTNYWMTGAVDDFRFIVGEALYTASFTPPALIQTNLVFENGVLVQAP